MFTSNKNAIFFTETGSPSSLPVIFIHGFPFTHEMWKEQLEVVGKNYRAIAYDFRGQGKSDLGDGQYTIESHVDDLLELVSFLKLQKVVLVGLSMGGYIALRAAERNPEILKGLVLCDTKSESDTDEGKIKRFQSMAEVKTNGTHGFAEANLKSVFAPSSFEKKSDAVQSIRQVIHTTEPKSIAANLLAMASRTNTTESLSKIKVPTLIMVGEKDVVTPPANAKSMHEKIKGSKLVTIPDAGHVSNLENSTVFNDMLLQFLNNL